MDGWSVLTKLKSDSALVHIPVIMATMLQDRPLGFALGAADFLTKPIDQAKLRALLNRLCGKGKGRVLIVDDDPMSRDVLARLLEKEGITTVEAVHGSAGLEAVAADPPDLILLDLMMPVMDGFDFLAALRSNPVTKEIPVIVVTAKDLTDADRARLNGGVREVIQKGSLDRDGLLRDVCTMISQAAPALPSTSSAKSNS
jgi:CheY-like chemotaxis protein